MSTETTLRSYLRIQRHVGSCREWPEDQNDRCGKPAEYVLWGKLIDTEGLGPRCYECAAKHVSHHALASRSQHAVINLRDLAVDIAADSSPLSEEEPRA